LALLDAIYGHGHLHTHVAMYAKMHASMAIGGAPWAACLPCDFDACARCVFAAAAAGRPVHEHALVMQDPSLAEPGCVCDVCKSGNDQGDISQALYWANRAVAILTAASGGAPTADLACAYEMVAGLLMHPGPNFNLAAVERLVAHALGLRRACGADEAPNDALRENLEEWKESRDGGAIDAHGLAVGAAVGATLALEGTGGEGGVMEAFADAYADFDEAAGEEGVAATIADKIKEQITWENLEKCVDFFGQFF
jgi:hypothetical protein